MKTYIIRFITGLAIIIFGVGLLLGNLDVFNFGEVIGKWWPLIVIGAGILVFINDVKSYIWALVIVAAGAMLQLKQLDVIDVNPWQFVWPVIIIAVGLSVIINRTASSRHISKSDRDDITAILGGSDQRNMSDDFKGSRVTAVLGGVKIDLRKATIKKEATLEVFSLMGGVEIIVPRDVIVKNQTSAILGGIEDKSEQDATKNAPILYVTGDVIMAGVEIKN